MLDIAETLQLALRSLAANKLRTALTWFGLVIAVGSLILVMTLVLGANDYVEHKLANLGTNVFEVTKIPRVITNFHELAEALKHKDISREDWQAVARRCRSCRMVGVSAETLGRVRAGNRSLTDIHIIGESANMATITTLELAAGRYFTDVEERQTTAVVILGHNAAQEFFPASDPLDRSIRVAGEEFRVIGVAEEIGSFLGQEQDNFVIVPLTTFEKLYGSRHSLTLKVQAFSQAAIPGTLQEVHTILRGSRRLRPEAQDDFYLATADTYLEIWKDISSVFFLVFVLISSIASLVGGIVITNIMLVTVTERTKEIGVRRSVGASQRDIQRQFLLEALTQCLSGGLVGVLLGFGVALALRQLTPFPASLRLWVALLGFLLSSVIAVVFGLYPAVKAARLDPAAALRTE